MSAPTTERVAPRAAGFHTLRVADVERLTDDAVAVTFDVPDDLADDFAFRPASPSRCAWSPRPATSAGPTRSARPRAPRRGSGCAR